MEASNVFEDVINYIEKSELNYCLMKKTPYSACISLKSSFIRRFGSDTPTIKEVKDDMYTSLTEENKILKEKLKCIQSAFKESLASETNVKVISDENKRLKDLYEKGKQKSKDLEAEISDFRSELLKVKNERNKSNQKVKTLEVEVSKQIEEIKTFLNENKVLKETLKKGEIVMKSKDEEITSLKRKSVSLQTKLDALQKNNVTDSRFSCQFCEQTTTLRIEMRDHVRNVHQKEKITQTVVVKSRDVGIDTIGEFDNAESTKAFEEYSCFYCDTVLKHQADLKVHKMSCHEAVPPVVGNYICDKCGTKCKNESDFNQHKTMYHAPWATPGTTLFWCNLCIMCYGTREGLQTHRRNWHKDHFG